MKDAHRLLTSRATVHHYRPAELPDGALDRAFEAALAAPNHRMTEPWRFLRVGPETRARLVPIAVELKAAKRRTEADDRLRAAVEAKFLDPAELVVAVQRVDADPTIEREDYAAIACALQNLMLALHSEGIGSKWSTGAVTRDARSLEILSVDAPDEIVVGFVWVGMAAAEAAKKPRRLAVGDVVSSMP